MRRKEGARRKGRERGGRVGTRDRRNGNLESDV